MSSRTAPSRASSRTPARPGGRPATRSTRPAWIRYTVYLLAAIVIVAFVSGVVFLH